MGRGPFSIDQKIKKWVMGLYVSRGVAYDTLSMR